MSTMRYGLDEEDTKRLEQWHYHGEVPNPERFVDINDATRIVARCMMERCPRSRELSLALTKLEEARMWANASIAVAEGRVAPKGVETTIKE